jgi:AraC-like DNA-binding protein
VRRTAASAASTITGCPSIARLPAELTLDEAARLLHAHPSHLVRAFGAEFGLPPHRYLTGRRVELARRLVLGGMPPAQVATAAGFHDRAHLTRHFRRVTGTTPGRFARG